MVIAWVEVILFFSSPIPPLRRLDDLDDLYPPPSLSFPSLDLIPRYIHILFSSTTESVTAGAATAGARMAMRWRRVVLPEQGLLMEMRMGRGRRKGMMRGRKPWAGRAVFDYFGTWEAIEKGIVGCLRRGKECPVLNRSSWELMVGFRRRGLWGARGS